MCESGGNVEMRGGISSATLVAVERVEGIGVAGERDRRSLIVDEG